MRTGVLHFFNLTIIPAVRTGRSGPQGRSSSTSDIQDHLGSVTEEHGHGTMTNRERDDIFAFADRLLLGKDVATITWDDSASHPAIS